MKKIIAGILLIMSVACFGCGSNEERQDQEVQEKHNWVAATCTSPSICSDCGETKGEPLGHDWLAATCTHPKTCKVCGKTEGEPIDHSWKEATCTEPKTCTVCGKTEGKPIDHSWKEATCTEPKTCSVCGKTEGDPLEHSWEEATCTKPKTCSICGATEGETIEHTWKEATCTEPKTCSVCGKTEGEALGHSCEKWSVSEKATCTEKGIETGVCTVCGEEVSRETEYAEHKPGDWEIDTKATIYSPGKKVKKCTVCGKVLETEEYEFEPFNTSKIKKRSNYKYDDFSKSWKYYETYDKKYSDATENITIIVFSEENGTNIEDIEIRASLHWKDAAATPWPIENVEFLIGDKIYHMDLRESDSGNMYFSILYTESSYEFIKALSGASKLKIKINYEYHSTELDLSSNPFKTLCKDIVDNNMWDYYIPNSFLALYDTTTVR